MEFMVPADCPDGNVTWLLTTGVGIGGGFDVFGGAGFDDVGGDTN